MKPILLLLVLLALPLSATETDWKEYINPRFGFKVSFPAGLVASRDPENGDGREYHTKDKEFSFSAWGHFLVDSTLDSLWQEDLKEFGNHITYKKKAADWFVISGFKDGAEFYHKVHAKDDNCAELSFRYPHAKAKQYDPWVEKIARSFVPFLKGDYDRIIK